MVLDFRVVTFSILANRLGAIVSLSGPSKNYATNRLMNLPSLVVYELCRLMKFR